MTHISEKKKLLFQTFTPYVAEKGWCWEAFDDALNKTPGTTQLLFKNDLNAVLKEFESFIDDALENEIGKIEGFSTLRVHEKVEISVLKRFEIMEPQKPVFLEIFKFLKKSPKAPQLLTISGRTCHKIWYICGDKSTDFNYYTKRLTLGLVYLSTYVFWIKSPQNNLEATHEFLKARLYSVSRIPKVKKRVKEGIIATFKTIEGKISPFNKQ